MALAPPRIADRAMCWRHLLCPVFFSHREMVIALSRCPTASSVTLGPSTNASAFAPDFLIFEEVEKSDIRRLTSSGDESESRKFLLHEFHYSGAFA